jgi:hypothetical protein
MYNLVIGVLLMLSSEKVAAFAGYMNTAHRDRLVRLARVSTFTFGSCVAVLSGTIYVAFHLLKLGL